MDTRRLQELHVQKIPQEGGYASYRVSSGKFAEWLRAVIWCFFHPNR
jgi:hypothetical protein